MSGKRFTNCPTCGGLCHYPSENFKQAGILVNDLREAKDIVKYINNKELLEEVSRRFKPLLEEMGFEVREEIPQPNIFVSSKYLASVIERFEEERNLLFGFTSSEIAHFNKKQKE